MSLALFQKTDVDPREIAHQLSRIADALEIIAGIPKPSPGPPEAEVSYSDPLDRLKEMADEMIEKGEIPE